LFLHNSNIEKIIVENKIAIAIVVNGEIIDSDLVLSGADYHHTETLLDKEHRAYSENIGTVAFSLLRHYFLCCFKKIENMSHHALFFDTDFTNIGIFMDEPRWPDEPLFYNFPSLTDKTAAPEGMESAFF
jgi:phytoene desaturase